MVQQVAGISVPDSKVARAASNGTRQRVSDLLYNHSCRVFIFGALLAARRGVQIDSDLLFVSAMFHDIGLVSGDQQARFEIGSANAARDFLTTHAFGEQARTDVWDAIALHTTPGVSEHKSVLATALRDGVETDLLGRHLDQITLDERRQTLAAYPREADFSSLIIEAFGAGLSHRPDTAFGTVYADVMERVDPSYRRINYCGLILGSDWADDLSKCPQVR